MLQNPPYYTTEAYNSNLQKRVRNQESCSPVCVVCVCVRACGAQGSFLSLSGRSWTKALSFLYCCLRL